MGVDHTKCRSCVYRADFNGDVCCYYCVIMKHRRPCPPGPDCTVYEPGKSRSQMVNEFTFPKKPDEYYYD